MKNKNVVLISGALIALATVAVYMLLCSSIFEVAISWIAVALTVISEAVTTVAFAFSGGDPRRVGGAIASLIQTVITIVASVFFIGGFPFFILMLKPYIALYAVTFVISSIIVLVLFNFAGNKADENAKTATAKATVIRSRTIVMSMINSEINSEAWKAHLTSLIQLDDDLRFMDDSVNDPMDAQILSQIQNLSAHYEEEDFPFDKTIGQIRDTIKQRNFIVKSYK